MIRRIRQQLRLIRYYSAPRRRTAWTRAADWSLLAALVLALPAAWLCDLLVHRQDAGLELRGGLATDPSGALVGRLEEDEGLRWTGDGVPHGEFEVVAVETRSGWPFASSARPGEIRWSFKSFATGLTREGAQMPADAPERETIALALSQSGHAGLLDAADGAATAPARRLWFGLLANVALWWLALALAMMFAIAATRLTVTTHRSGRSQRAARRAARGLCHVCGYDLRGLEFNERCPECGALVR
jgi:hypothetical protein